MKKYMWVLVLGITGTWLQAMEPKVHAVIENASYYIIEGMEKEIIGGIPAAAQYATFYDAEGNEVGKVQKHEHDFFHLDALLDTNAPKPKPASYAIKYWPAISIGFGMRKGVPGYFVVLKDKNGNYFKSWRYNEKTDRVILSFDESPIDLRDLENQVTEFDLHGCVEADSDSIKDHDQQNNNGKCVIQ